jgi:hypothetical protein
MKRVSRILNSPLSEKIMNFKAKGEGLKLQDRMENIIKNANPSWENRA